MKPEIKKLWVDALRSGEYKQCTGSLIRYPDHEELKLIKTIVPDEALLNESSFCCLGVLCDLYRKETGQNLWKNGSFNNNYGVLPAIVLEWSGLIHHNPIVKVSSNLDNITISQANDYYNHDFNMIADVIEKQL